MKDKNVIILFFSLVTIFAIFAIIINLDHEDVEKIRSLTYNDYEKTLAKDESPYTLEDIQNSDAAYLLDTDFVITEENVEKVIHDYFSAPTRLFFIVYTSDDFSGNFDWQYKCDDLSVNATFAEIFHNKIIMREEQPECLILTNINSQYFFTNTIGELTVSCSKGFTYIEFTRFAFRGNCFLITKDLTKKMDSTIKESMPYFMEIWNPA